MPKGFVKKLNFIQQKIGVERRQEMLDDITDSGTYLPKGVGYEDIDETFVEFVNKDLSVVVDGEKVPVIFLTIQRWSEFSRTWQFSDKYKNIKMPFITVVRQPNPQVGTNQAGLYNIPGRNTYTFIKVPTFKNGRRGVDLYKIPQPVAVDFLYEVRIFCNRMRDLNKLNFKVQQIFQSRQFYISPNGHPMPVTLESIGDESNIDDFENRRFYVQPYEMKVAAYIQDEESFEVVPLPNRSIVAIEVDDKIKTKTNFSETKKGSEILYQFVFQPKDNNTFIFNTRHNIEITSIQSIELITNIQIIINDVIVFDGITIPPSTFIPINTNTKVKIIVNRNTSDLSKFMLISNIK